MLAGIMGVRYQGAQTALAFTKPYKIDTSVPVVPPVGNVPVANTPTAQSGARGTRTVPVVAGMKRKAGDDMINSSSD